MLRYFMRQRADSRSPCDFSSVSFVCVCVFWSSSLFECTNLSIERGVEGGGEGAVVSSSSRNLLFIMAMREFAPTAGRLSILFSGNNSSSRRRKTVEQLWREFFSDPSQWWDHRSEKDFSSMFLEECKISGFQAQDNREQGAVARRQLEQSCMGASGACSNGTRKCTIKQFLIQPKACQVCEDWETCRDIKAVSTTATRTRHDS